MPALSAMIIKNSPIEIHNATCQPGTTDPGPLINAPNKATPSTLPVCRAVFNVPDATPDRSRAVLPSNAEVIAGTIKPSPKPSAVN